MTLVNQDVFDRVSEGSLSFRQEDPYANALINLRISLMKRHCTNAAVLDLGCGSGEYTLLAARHARSVVGLDYSRRMLDAARKRARQDNAEHLFFIKANAHHICCKNSAFDTAYSFATLYFIPEVQKTVAEIARILKPGGYAILCFGNRWRLNALFNRTASSGLKVFLHTPREMWKMLKEAGLAIEEVRRFQLLPMYPGRLFKTRWLGRLAGRIASGEGLAMRWLLSRKLGEKTLDERICSWPVFRLFAYRHLFICRKDNHEGDH